MEVSGEGEKRCSKAAVRCHRGDCVIEVVTLHLERNVEKELPYNLILHKLKM